MELVSVKYELLNILFFIIVLFLLYLFCCISVSFLHSLLCNTIQLIIVHLLLRLFIQNTHLLQWIRRIATHQYFYFLDQKDKNLLNLFYVY